MNTLLADRVVTSPRATVPDRAPYPEALVLDWTDYCNAKCFFCYREKYEQNIGGKGDFIPFAKLRNLEKVLSSIKFFGISSAIGEPLLHPELEQILQWLYEINPKILTRTTTNGTALTADKSAWFAGRIDWLSVSLNAADGEAHMRDMFPHLAKRGIDAGKRWELHLRHLTEFIDALPPGDRPRIRLQMVAHRQNVKDIVNFVRVVERVGGSHAVITNIAAHPDTVDSSLYWVRDQYNAAVDEAREIGTQLGVRVDAARFYTSVKPVLDLDKMCRDPIDTAYISRASVGAPCCHWLSETIPTEVYASEDGFDDYWNHDILRQLRQKRDFESCRVCGMSRVFDEASFHFSPSLKKELIASGKLSEINRENDYPDARLVRTCIENRVDLPNLRHTLRALNLPPEMSGEIETRGLAALAALEDACWEAFQKADIPAVASHLPLAGPFLGVGWGVPIHVPQNRVSARWLGGAQAASVFVRVQPGTNYEIHLTIHHSHPTDLVLKLQLAVCGRPIETWRSRNQADRSVLRGLVPDDLVQAQDGRLWVRVGLLNDDGKLPSGHISFIGLEMSETSEITALELQLAKNDVLQEQQALRITALEQRLSQRDLQLAQQEQQLQAIYNSSSWRITAPFRKITNWLRQ